MPQSGKLPVLDLLAGQKSAFLSRRGDSLHMIHVKFGTTKGHVGPLGRTKFQVHGVGTRPPKCQKFPLFGVKSRLAPLTDF